MRNAASRKQNSGPSCCFTPSTRKQTDADVTSPNQAFSSFLLMLTLLQLPRRQGDTTLRHPACKTSQPYALQQSETCAGSGMKCSEFFGCASRHTQLVVSVLEKKAGLNWPATYVVPIGYGWRNVICAGQSAIKLPEHVGQLHACLPLVPT